MKEDVLEQIVDDYLMHLGYFTRHNLRFKPDKDDAAYVSKTDSVPSDIDVVGIHPHKSGTERVWVLSCKSWQKGFDPAAKARQIDLNSTVSGREAWKSFRELCEPRWSAAFLKSVEAAVGTRQFTYVTVVTHLKNDAKRALWEERAQFKTALEGNPIRILTLKEMLEYLWRTLATTPAASEIGRAVQLMKAARWSPPH